MFDKIAYTWELMKASNDVLRRDKELLVFPLISSIACVLVLASFALPIWFTKSYEFPDETAAMINKVAYYGVVFLYYVCNYFIITFFNTAIVAGAVERMSGGDPTVGSCLRAAFDRLPQVLGWALVAATVGLVLRTIEENSKMVGRIVAGLIGMAFTIVSFLVVPVLVVERKGPIEAFKESASLLRKTWGEQIVGNFSFGLLFFVLSLPAYLLIGLGIAGAIALESLALGVAGIALGVVYLIGLALWQSALQAIFQAAVYLHVADRLNPNAYPAKLLGDAMRRK